MVNVGYLQITRICNHQCLYCSNPSNGKMLGLDEIKAGIVDMKKSGYTDLILTGGEPTIHPKLFEIMDLCNENGIAPRIITNGQKLADESFVKSLVDHGIQIVHLSIYTYKSGLNDEIRNVKDAFKSMLKALFNLQKYNVTTQVTITISRLNQDHLLKTVKFIKEISSNITHFVFNILDPQMMPKSEQSLNSIPDLNTLKPELLLTLNFLESVGFTFRVERIPLCKISGFERSNTECRKIVKKESRKVLFLDERDAVEQSFEGFRHDFLVECEKCVLKEICGGIYMHNKYYGNVVVEPVLDNNICNDIVSRILA